MFDNHVVQHAYREANQCADALATLGLNLHVPFMDFVHPPLVVETLLAFDKAELFYTRMYVLNIIFLFNKKKKKKRD